MGAGGSGQAGKGRPSGNSSFPALLLDTGMFICDKVTKIKYTNTHNTENSKSDLENLGKTDRLYQYLSPG